MRHNRLRKSTGKLARALESTAFLFADLKTHIAADRMNVDGLNTIERSLDREKAGASLASQAADSESCFVHSNMRNWLMKFNR